MSVIWHGRDDSADSGDTRRWHHVVQDFGPGADEGVALIGFACDEGVRRNGGRSGAAEGPAVLRAALANLPLAGEPMLYDAGDIACEGTALEAMQAALGERVARVRAQGVLPLVLGGGHEMAWGTFQGLVPALATGRRLAIVNLDAHFDLREAPAGNSGTPFRQMHDWCIEHGAAFDYFALGISRYSNTRALFDRAAGFGVHFWPDDALQDPAGADAAGAALASGLASADDVYLTVCLDVLPGEKAPGVSAPAALGVPLACIERIVDAVMRSGRIVAADIAEFNPRFDRDGLTARVAARLAARIARGSTQATAPSLRSPPAPAAPHGSSKPSRST
ncbi:MAG: formimidoylglutamase [Proteobacteria bacterium]|jgi:formiminoglutamase|nr:formimidoylglutamase [Pseudomonadota bacterium]